MTGRVIPTPTLSEQEALEYRIGELYEDFELCSKDQLQENLTLFREAHALYLQKGLGQLPSYFASLDASRPWMCFWMLHGLALLNAPLPESPNASDIIHFLNCCQWLGGGFGGGPMQIAHLAPTYASVAALLTIGGSEALSCINRPKMSEFLSHMCLSEEKGCGFSIHEGGECDLRACYLAIAVSHMLGLDTEYLAKKSNVAKYVARCQTYEGGLGGEPGNEAHGGYTFCGVATLVMVGQAGLLNIPALLHWLAMRQCDVEGGFNGRTNKLVDGCYSYWQGGVFALLHKLSCEHLCQIQVPRAPHAGAAAVEEASALCLPLPATLVQDGPSASEDSDDAPYPPLSCRASRMVQKLQSSGSVQHSSMPVPPCIFSSEALQIWILKACQSPEGGLCDKPGKRVDFYHTSYCLSGLSSAQHSSGKVLGPPKNLLKKADPLVNILEERLAEARAFFSQHPL